MVLSGVAGPAVAAPVAADAQAAALALPDTQSPKQCNPPVTLVNGGFEQPAISLGGNQTMNDSQVPGWTVANSANDHLVEMWSTGFLSTPSAEGKQFVELNANLPSTLFQDVATTPGQVLRWSLKHRGRSGTDVMDVLIGSPSGTLASQTKGLSDGMAWGTHTGTYTVPAGQTTSRFAFKAISSSNNNPSYGNFLDDISFGTQPCVITTKSVTNLNGRSPAQAGDILRYTVDTGNNGGTPAKQMVLNDTIPTGTSYVPGSMKILTGPGQGSYTDAVGDDRAEFTANAVKIRLGNGAMATAGGDLSPATTTSVTFDVSVNAAATAVDVVNVANVKYGDDWDALTKTATTNTVATPVAPAADLAVAKKINTSPVIAGKSISYTITASNKGPANATGVTVVDQLPSGLANAVGTVNGQPCTVAGASMSCAVGNLANQASVDIAVTADVPAATDPGALLSNTVRISGNETDPVSANNVAAANATVATSADLAITKEFTPVIPVAGEAVTYTLKVNNAGPSDARNVTVVDPLDPEVTFVSAAVTAGGGVCPPPTAGVVSCDLGTVPVGGTVTIQVVATIAPGADAVVQNSAAVSSSTPDPDSSNNASSVKFQPTMVSDIEVTKAVVAPSDPSKVAAGGSVSYAVTVKNNGSSVAKNTVLTDTLPAGLTLTSVTGAASCVSSPSAPEIRCEWASLAVDEVATITIVATVDPNTPAGSIRNTATAVSAAFDVNPANNSASADITVITNADLAVAKTATISPIVPGLKDGMKYKILLTNNGPSTASAVVVSDAIPAGMLSATTSTPGCIIDGGVLSCLIARLAPDAVGVSIEITGTLDPAYSGASIGNTAVVTSATPDNKPENNTSAVTTPVKPDVDIAVTKTASGAAVNQGGASDYVITITNKGPSAAHDVRLTDAPGPGLTLGSGGSDTGVYDYRDGSWSVGSLAVGETKELRVSNNAVSSGALSNTVTAVTSSNEQAFNMANNTATAKVTSAPSADVAITKTVNNAAPKQGDTVRYSLKVTNFGPADAVGVVANDALPVGVQIVSAVSSVGSYDFGTGDWTIGTLANGATQTLTLTVTVTGAGAITNTATVASSTYDPVKANNTADAILNSAPSADLAIVKTLTSGPMIAGTKASYELTITNKGPSDATALTIADTVPVSLTNATAISSKAICTVVNQQVNCAAETLARGDTFTVAVSADIPANAVVGTVVANTATVTGAQHDPSPSDNVSTVVGIVTAATDVGIVKTLLTEIPVAGQDVSYELAVTNAGPSDAANVSVTDIRNADLTIVSVVTPQGSCTTAAVIRCDLGTVAAGQSVKLTMVAKVVSSVIDKTNNTATVSTSTPDTNPANDASSVGFQPVTEADLVVTKQASTPIIVAGASFSYTVGVQNNGPSDAQFVVLSDTVPAGMKISVVDNNACAINQAKTGIECTWATLAAGADQSVTVYVLVDAAAIPGATINTASALSGTFDPDASNNAASAPVEIIASADLSTIKKAKSAATPGKPLSYTVEVSNNGPSMARGVNLTDMLPSELKNASSLTAGCTVTGQLLSCLVDTLAFGDTFTAEITADVDPAFAGGTITNVATATSATPDQNLTNNAGKAVVAATPVADLSVTKTANAVSVNQGEEVTYQLTVRNNGPSSAAGVQVLEKPGAGVRIDSAQPSEGAWDGASSTWTIGALASGAEATLTLTATMTGAGTLTNAASVSADTVDPNPANNAASVDVETAPTADVAILKTASSPAPLAGETVTYTLTVSNYGPSAAQNVVVTDPLADGLGANSISTDKGTCVATSPLKCTIDSLGQGETAVITIVAKVSPELDATQLSNTATVTSATHDADLSNNSSTVSVAPTALADIAVTKKASATSVSVGGEISYELVVTNAGPATAKGVIVTDPLPVGLTAVQSSSTAGTCSGDATVLCALGDLAPGANVTVDIKVSVAAAAIPGMSTNTAMVTSPTPDPDVANNSSSAAVMITGLADLAVSKSAERSEAVLGDNLTYTITVSNAGPSAALNPVVTDVLPKGLSFVSAKPSTGAYDSVTGAWTMPSLASGSSATLLVVTKVDAVGKIVNTATARSDTPDPSAPNNASSAEIISTAPVVPGAGLGSTGAAIAGPLGLALALLAIGFVVVGIRRRKVS